jgi:hypothetical protein
MEDLQRNEFKGSFLFEHSETKQHVISKLPNIFDDLESNHVESDFDIGNVAHCEELMKKIYRQEHQVIQRI